MRWFLLLLLATACDDPGSALFVTDARILRGPDNRILVDVDLEAHEGDGRNIGTYCVRATFDGQPNYAQSCRQDLKDGDTTTVRLVSDTALKGAPKVKVRVRVAETDVGRDLVAPNL